MDLKSWYILAIYCFHPPCIPINKLPESEEALFTSTIQLCEHHILKHKPTLEFLAKPAQQYIESSVYKEFCQTAWLESCRSWDRPMWLPWQAEVGLGSEK